MLGQSPVNFKVAALAKKTAKETAKTAAKEASKETAKAVKPHQLS